MTSIFEEIPTTPTLDQFVGEGKKYSDNDAVAKALVEKDTFINRLLEEKRQLEADHRAALNLQAFKDRIDALEAAQVERAAPTPPPTATPAPPAPAQPGIDEATVQRIIEQREASNKRNRNLMEVKEKLTNAFGQDYPTRVKAKAAELGIEIGRLNEMAAETPAAFYALIGMNEVREPVSSAPPASRVNSAAAFNPSVGKKNNAYYSNMRKTNPAEYFTPRIALEEMNEAKRQGPAFYDP